MGANRPFLRFLFLFLFLIPILFIFLFFKPTFTISNPIFPLKHTTNSHPFLFPCLPPHHNSHTFCNTSLPITTRAQTLLSLLTLEEKIQQLGNNASAVPRLGIPAYQWWSESLHGLAPNGPGVDFSGDITAATNFPQVILTTAGFNRTLWFLIGSAIAVEARAMYNAKQAGLTFWAPNINIFRDPRWGRGQETSGEDPMVASAYSIEYVRGFQGGNWRVGGGSSEEIGEKRKLKDDGGSDDLMLSACCKHFTAYDLEKWGSFNRYNFNAVVTLQDMEDTYQPPFRSCISQGKASCLMCSYNSVDEVPACARKDLLDVARNEWGFKGYITSDCDAVATLYEYHHYAESPEDAAADVLKAGMDIDCGTYLSRHTLEAVKQGKLQEEDIDRALINLFLVHLRLGRFDGDPREGKFGRLGPKDVCTSEHQKLALEAARQGIVLLKNDKKFLPLKKDSYSSLAIIGPLAKNATYLNGDYTGTPCSDKSIFDGLQEYTTTISYAAGCFDVACDSDVGFDEAIRTAKEADFVVVVAGLALSQETEELDRYSLLLPGKQMALLSCVAAASKKPVILVLIGGGSLDVSFAKADPKIAGILWIGYPGEAGAQALAEIIFGDVNPSGRLPVTWYPESFVAIPMTDMHMRADPSRGYPGRTYRFYTGSTVYSFGQGLSYTTYSYKFLSAPNRLSLSESSKFGSRKNLPHQVGDGIDYINTDDFTSCASLKFSVEISVMNVGDMDGSHVVMLFSRAGNAIKGSPLKQLVGFNRVYTISNQSSTTSILVDPCKDLSFANEFGKRVLPLGDHLLMLGDLEHSFTIEA